MACWCLKIIKLTILNYFSAYVGLIITCVPLSLMESEATRLLAEYFGGIRE